MFSVTRSLQSDIPRRIDRKRVAKAAIAVLRLCGAVPVARTLSRAVRWCSYHCHQLQYFLQYGGDTKPDWFDHYIDLHYGWTRTGNPQAWERGIFNLLALRPGGKLLELCGGDGFNARYFYAAKSAYITSIDINRQAVAHANRLHGSYRIRFLLGDIRSDIPSGQFDNVVWDSALCLFPPAEAEAILRTLKTRMLPGGVLSGHIGYEPENTALNAVRYDSIEELELRLKPVFENVRIFSTRHDGRYNLYFYASDGPVPFDDDWVGMKRTGDADADRRDDVAPAVPSGSRPADQG